MSWQPILHKLLMTQPGSELIFVFIFVFIFAVIVLGLLFVVVIQRRPEQRLIQYIQCIQFSSDHFSAFFNTINRVTGKIQSGHTESSTEIVVMNREPTMHPESSLFQQPLSELVYTVFDTETTGLNPFQDEIVSIGAVRIVDRNQLRHEVFEQLIDPRIPIPQRAQVIHGISSEMVKGQPLLKSVLPHFRTFVTDTVLVGHNVAFDMRMLQIKERATGVFFDLPVLDTLLLSAVLRPGRKGHSLEELSTWLGVNVVGRHSALGDAMLTAEIFLRLIPLLEERGIVTLAQAQEASQKTWYARLEY